MLFIRHGVIVRSEGDQIIKNIVSKEKRLKSWQTTIVVNEEISNKLKKVLANYLDILSKPRIRGQIIKSFNFRSLFRFAFHRYDRVVIFIII